MKRASLVVTTLILASLWLQPWPANANQLRPFTSDGCSAFPDGTLTEPQLWLHCCTEHDFAYWRGGSFAERLAADRALQQCVGATGEQVIAGLMLAGVRVGGTPYLPTGFRWGYGWEELRGYSTLSAAEEALVGQQLSDDRSPVAAPAAAIPPAIDNLHQVSAELYRSAQPTATGFAELREFGIRSVLDLRALHDDEDEDESAGLDLQLYHVPMYAFWFSEAQLLRAMRIIRDAPKPILVHCQHGSDRTGTVVALYRMLFQGWSKDAAIAEMTSDSYGFHPIFSNLVHGLQRLDLEQFRDELSKDRQK